MLHLCLSPTDNQGIFHAKTHVDLKKKTYPTKRRLICKALKHMVRAKNDCLLQELWAAVCHTCVVVDWNVDKAQKL